MSLEAIEVLQRVRVRAASKEWCKSIYKVTDIYGVDRACLGQMVSEEVMKANKSSYPTPLDGEVFRTLWACIPSNSTIPSFNDAWETTQEDVVRVVDKAMERIFWRSLLRFLTPQE